MAQPEGLQEATVGGDARPPQASQDAFAETMVIAGPVGWLVVAVLAAALLGAAAWSAVVEVPIRVKGRGLLLSEAGIAEVALSTRGRILALDVKPGDTIAAGDLVAEVSQPDMEMQLSVREVQLREARARAEALTAFQLRSAAAQTETGSARLEAARQRIVLMAEREQALREREAVQRDMLARGLATREALLRAQAELAGVIDQGAIARSEVAAAESEMRLQRIQAERELLAVREEIARIENEAGETRRVLALNRELRSPHAGRVLEVKHAPGDVVEAGGAVVVVERSAGPGALIAVAFVAPEFGKEIRPGMRADIAPSGIRANEYGFIRGRVLRVSEQPVTTSGMNHVLRNDQLVRQLSQNGAPFEVQIQLERAPTASGFAWTASAGPPVPIGSGTPCEVNVATRDMRLLALLVPQAAQLLAR